MAKTIELKIRYVPVGTLKPYQNNARTHSKKQISQIAASIRRFGMVTPILVDGDGTIIAGHGKFMAAIECGLPDVPAVRVDHMTEADRKAYVIADNRLAELSGWDDDILRIEFQNIESLVADYPLEITGFDTGRIDLITGDPISKIDPADEVPENEEVVVTRQGDLWVLGDHRLICGDAQETAVYARLMGDERARMSFVDPPYNVPIEGHVSGLGAKTHREFVMAAGELDEDEFVDLLASAMTQVADYSINGSIHFWAMDWRHLDELSLARKRARLEMKNLIVWNKTNAGMGAFYRSQHELFYVLKKGNEKHTNNFGLGESGRYRTNVWNYAGANTFKRDRAEELDWHPTVKPTVLVVDAIRDVSKRGDIVIDCFAGSGTTAIAAEKTKRKARLIELDPRYCDTIIRRFMTYTGKSVRHADTGLDFDDLSQQRVQEIAPAG
ncbi:MAG: DNA methyltransferase [Mesorhizobium sp.]